MKLFTTDDNGRTPDHQYPIAHLGAFCSGELIKVTVQNFHLGVLLGEYFKCFELTCTVAMVTENGRQNRLE